MNEYTRFVNWINSLDWATILYGVATAAIVSLFVWWKGGIRSLWAAYRRHSALDRYRKSLSADLSHLPIIGRKEGFGLETAYVQLGIAPSDLMAEPGASQHSPPKAFVLVGGPGAGKSTYVKKAVLNNLAKSKTLSFFVRLRDYEKSASIEELLARPLRNLGIKDAQGLVRDHLHRQDCLTVLDGFDEVRPQVLNEAHNAINGFYGKFFSGGTGGRLIVTCRKEAYRSIPLNIAEIWETIPLTDSQIRLFAKTWPLGYPKGRSAEEFWSDLSGNEKILEVSRSPLLLVGSLLLYTESGLGIPGQRTKYLEKIKRTLVEEWATAQGQPPDPLRDAYTPVLIETALRMHMRTTAELPIHEFLELLREILPKVGFESDHAEEFADSVIRRTGILVRDIPSHIVFVHFTLQEYFASLQLTASEDATKIASLEPKAWWREAILFTVAQVPDPSRLIEALFEDSPTLGIMAVSEAPTPSLRIQQDAIEVLFSKIDLGSKASIPAIVALLRKVSGKLADELCFALEKRLEDSDKKVSSNIGQALASAGTDQATEIVSRHPDTWQHFQGSTGFLSRKFQESLLNWVRTPENQNWNNAAELATRLRMDDNEAELLSIIRELPSDKSDRLATMFITKLYEDDDLERRTIIGEDAPLFAALPYVRDPEKLLNELPEGGKTFPGPGLVKTALAMRVLEHPTVSREQLHIDTHFHNASTWCMHATTFGAFFISCVMTCVYFVQFPNLTASYISGIISAAALVFCAVFGPRFPPWIVVTSFRSHNPVGVSLLMFIGVALALSVAQIPQASSQMSSRNAMAALLGAALITAFGPAWSLANQHPFVPRRASDILIFVFWYCLFLWIVGLLAAAYAFSNNLVSTDVVAAASLFVALIPACAILRTGLSWRKVAAAARFAGRS